MDIDKMKHKFRNHIKGMIYGQALGDAVRLVNKFEKKHNNEYKISDWTESTDQMILLMDTIIESNHNFYEETLCSEKNIENFCKKILDWKNNGFPELGENKRMNSNTITNIILNHKNFKETPIDVSKEIWLNYNKKIASNEALMKTSILSILNIYKFFREPTTIHQDFYRSIRTMCIIMHYDVRCIISCWMLCYFIQHVLYAVLKGDNKILLNLKVNSYKTCMHLLKTIPKNHYPIVIPKNINEKKFYNINGEYNIKNELIEYYKSNLKELKLNEISQHYTYTSLGYVFWIMDLISKYELNKILLSESYKLNFEKIIIKIINDNGDSNINASIAGSLLGSYLGYDNLPIKWLEALPNKKWLDEKINKLFERMDL